MPFKKKKSSTKDVSDSEDIEEPSEPDLVEDDDLGEADGDEDGEGGEGGEGGEEGEAGEEGGAGGAGGGGGGSKPTKKSQRRKTGQRNKLPNKVMDFQVRIHILEGRQLVGSGINPVVKVICGKDIQETSIQKGTNSPSWDQVLFFNMKELPSEMFDRIVDVKILNAKRVVFDALIGSFKFDLGMVYDEPEHCFIHKWLLLTDPGDSGGAAKGYLKVSIQILGPGDDPKPSPSDIGQETVDIESNLLRPSGVRLVPGTLTIRVIRGEDLPQMDAGYFEGIKKILRVGTVQKELVDPYCIVNFAGHKGRTAVIWNEQDPEWNRQINLGVRLPSMCERIRFQVKDKDRANKDDYIGTCFLNLSHIQAPGETGFPPTYGPCFINMYGSPREFSDLPDKFEYLNKGLIEGVSYRGRVMVEVEMSIGNFPAVKTEDITPENQKRFTPFLRRRKYKLFGAFFSASMVDPKDAPVEFEVSIGNYGNKLDENSPAQSSTTPPSNPIYDGNAYYYLPWLDQKPCVVVDSQWEDCSFRIDTLNIILFTAEGLQEGVTSVQKMIEVDAYDVDAVKSQIGEVLDMLSENLDQMLPPVPEQGFTRLDTQLRSYRESEWACMREEADELRRDMPQYNILELVTKLEDFVARIKSLAIEPQNSVPDVVVWMLSGQKRVAVKRIPSHELMYSTVAKARGKNCGKLQTIFLGPPALQKEKELKECTSGSQVRLMLWLGLEKDQKEWTRHTPGGKLATFAETYENEACLFGRWGKTGLTRPQWCDSRGKIKQPKEQFETPPPGWAWDGDWTVSPELSIAFEPDEGLDEWMEDIFENQLRLPLSHWPVESESYWTDVRGDKLVEYEGKNEKQLTRDDIKLPEGWLWKEEQPWAVDINRGVDEHGWEYAVEAGIGAWVPYERNIHMSRRRRWVRIRVRDKDSKAIEKKKKKREKAMSEGWEYARLAHLTYHITEHRLDFARRRRWARRLINLEPGARAVFTFEGKNEKKKKKKDDDSDDEDEKKQQVPRMYLTFSDCHTYQLRAYLYQARDMFSSDKSGLSDPYAIMAFGRYSTRSRIIKESVCPTWDQTMLINHIRMFGDPQSILDSPPPVTVEFFDRDQIGKDELLGNSKTNPTVRLTLDTPSPRLDWFEIVRYNTPVGELLAGFELLLDEGGELPFTPPKASPPHTHYIVPSGIRPVLQKTRVEILCWGVRDMKRYQLLKVTSPLVELECGGTIVRSEPIKDTDENPNFPKPVISFDVYLPKEELYAPPLNIRILDKRSFGRLPMVGTNIIKSLKPFYVHPTLSATEMAAFQAVHTASTPNVTPAPSVSDVQTALELEEGEKKDLDTDPDSKETSDFDWWSKYYYSCGDERRTQAEYVEQGADKLVVYPTELEEAFNRFTDLTQTFPLTRGKGSRDPEDVGAVGYFKGTVKMYPLPDDGSPEPKPLLANVPSTEPIDVVVRVYIIRAIDLQPQDPGGKSDPYIKIKLGKNKINDKDSYIPNQLNPIFGKMFELPATLPKDHTLTVTVMDWDRLSADDLIGETKIDLENRFLSHHRATVGLPETMARRGPNKWRDMQFPVEILDDWCKTNNLPEPEWSPDHAYVIIDGTKYTLDQFEQGKPLHQDLTDVPQQRLALHFLRQQNLVPEHIETRNIFTPMQPGISQGQLHMWVDMFRKDGNIPPPVDVSPRKPQKYVLRIVVWNLKDVILDEVSVATGEAMSDIYVKGWLRGEDDTQKTDVHYRSLDGDGNFNWRFVFPIEYLPAENIMVIKKKEHFYSLTKTERHLPPILTMQIWDNDLFSPDDFLGTVDFNLSRMPKPVNDAASCNLEQLPDATHDAPHDDLFKRKRMKGWWPSYEVNDEGVRELNGKMELEFELVPEEEALLRPSGRARDDPNMHPVLDPPNRPATSFLWFTSPWKTFKFIVWKFYKWHIIGTLVVILLVIIIVIFVYTAPNTLMTQITSRILPG
ncbi:myoferlin-like isoform X2 [Halichondria panicea]|uniref:myoferlin-like isoform X2 n=1 Tax=Halichondria panicea TaxID=6063 RepID=UPI00312B6E54